jgi:hypothetical protein
MAKFEAKVWLQRKKTFPSHQLAATPGQYNKLAHVQQAQF